AGKVSFDFSGSGDLTPTGWMGADTGMLLLDTNGKGILGEGTSVIQGFGALAALDPNNQGEINKNDPLYTKIQVWDDANTNGRIDPGELRSLQSLGIASISLHSQPVSQNIAGDTITAIGLLTFTDGTTE